MQKDSPIGFFDSGVGGLSVYSRFRELLPCENTIYYGDLKNLPYGNKTQEELICFAKNILDFFKAKNVKAVVIACNTSSALAYDYVKDDYNFKIYPIIQSCAKVIAGMNNVNRIGIFATVGTVNSGAYKREITKYNPNIAVQEIACPNWVSIVEGFYKNGDTDIKEHLEAMLKFKPDKIVLGCTHYPYLMDTLTKHAPKDLFIDPSEIFVKYISHDILRTDITKTGYEEFYVSAEPELFMRNSQLFYKIKSSPKLVEYSVL